MITRIVAVARRNETARYSIVFAGAAGAKKL